MKPVESAQIQAVVATPLSLASQACDRIAPTWPLDQLIAVNPWWQLRDQPMSGAAARLAALGNVHCLMPRSYYRELWPQLIKAEHLQQALAEFPNVQADVQQLTEHLQTPEKSTHWQNVSDLMDALQGSTKRMTWGEEIKHQISQFCASYFQARDARACAASPKHHDRAEPSLYESWLSSVRSDRGIQILMGEAGLQVHFQALPADFRSVFQFAFNELQVVQDHAVDYLHALLLDINGWASLVAYYDRFAGAQSRSADGDMLLQLLAVRLAWECALWCHFGKSHPVVWARLNTQWQTQWHDFPRLIDARRQEQALTWVWQRAAENAYAQSMHQKLRAEPDQQAGQPPQMQAVFCIDVRSEPMRRALEQQSPEIQTLGFAGFFGLPISYQTLGAVGSEPRLPGLLNSQIQAVESCPDQQCTAHKRAGWLNRKARLQGHGASAPSTFNLVESVGLAYVAKLFKDSFFPGANPATDLAHAQAMHWDLVKDGVALTHQERADLAARILRAMGLITNFAPVVLLVGHGSSSRNNPHAAGLDCGACGGHAGHLNARVLAMVLNDKAVRSLLVQQGIEIPDQTRFVPGLHDTTTDEITLFDQSVPPIQQRWLRDASVQARRHRAPSLGMSVGSDAALEKQLIRRSRDWSQPRPEWGLANNAAFIAAPRSRTKRQDLQGRAFLHDYNWQSDAGFQVLELIMTAPMVVAHWINMQYYASVVDHQRYGSGNKILHNVVGGHLGVFEGNGGDLRIGLPLQSVHDGKRWRHEPLRLAVYLAAPPDAIVDIYRRHTAVQHLVDNRWLHLYRLDDDPQIIEQLYDGQWHGVQ